MINMRSIQMTGAAYRINLRHGGTWADAILQARFSDEPCAGIKQNFARSLPSAPAGFQWEIVCHRVRNDFGWGAPGPFELRADMRAIGFVPKRDSFWDTTPAPTIPAF